LNTILIPLSLNNSYTILQHPIFKNIRENRLIDCLNYFNVWKNSFKHFEIEINNNDAKNFIIKYSNYSNINASIPLNDIGLNSIFVNSIAIAGLFFFYF
jgi:hypothetical protein